MNWRLSQLDGIAITSNSDAHSPKNLGREATVFNCDLNYLEIINAVKTNDQRLLGTIEFFPEEGKYHYDGHRACGVSLSPPESEKLNNLCPVCGELLVLGVDHRVADLDDRPHDYRPQNHKLVEYIIPLSELIAQIQKVGKLSKRVDQEYLRLYSALGDEFSILRKIGIADIDRAGFPQIAQAVELMRQGKIDVTPGYDGVYGVIKVSAQPGNGRAGQMSLL